MKYNKEPLKGTALRGSDDDHVGGSFELMREMLSVLGVYMSNSHEEICETVEWLQTSSFGEIFPEMLQALADLNLVKGHVDKLWAESEVLDEAYRKTVRSGLAQGLKLALIHYEVKLASCAFLAFEHLPAFRRDTTI